MLSKRTKIIVSLVSISILSFLITSTLAASYHREQEFWAEQNDSVQFRIIGTLDVTTEEGSLGPIIDTYDEDYEFKTTWFIFWPNYQFVDVQETIRFTYNTVKEKIAVKYTITGKVWSYWDHSKYVMVQLWIKIWADGSVSSDATYWDDHFGFTYLKSF